MPVLASLLLRRSVAEKETRFIKRAHALYQPLLSHAMAHPAATAAIAAGWFAISLCIAPFLGAEFIPRLDEDAIAIQAWRLPSVSLEESIRNTTMIEKLLRRFPEVWTIVSRTGTGEIPTDPMGVEMSDIYLILKPRNQWKTAKTQSGLIRAFDSELEKAIPGTQFSYSQPIELRVQELIAGVRSDVAIAIYGEDLSTLKRLGDELVRVVSSVPGAADTKAEQVAGTWYLRIAIDRDAISRYGINASDVLGTVQALAGKTVGTYLEGERRFAIQVRFRPEDRLNPEEIGELRVSDTAVDSCPSSSSQGSALRRARPRSAAKISIAG